MDTRAIVERKSLGPGVLQTRLDGALHFIARDLQFCDSFAQIAQTCCGLLQPFGGIGYSPSPEPARRPLERVRCRSRVTWFGACDPFQHQRDLARENLQNLALEAFIAQRHASQVVLVKDPTHQFPAGFGRPSRLFHNVLSPPGILWFCARRRYHSIGVPKAG